MVHLGCLASGTLGEPSLLEMAIGAGWNALEAAPGILDLCCGLAGRGYALLALHRATGEPRWLERARELAETGAAAAEALESEEHPPYALYKGALGLILLASDLDRPDLAAMPVFGDEGWRSAGRA
jgi:serine/threonine-protein kinase